nr:MAG TPA: deoxyribosyltransferase [Caudoviricetes sp.]
MSTCEQCYHGSATGLRGVGTVCLYILHEKRRRPCPGGAGCAEFITPGDYLRRPKEKEPMPRIRKDWTQDEEAKLLQMWDAGKTYKEMGEALGRTPKSVQQHVYYMQSHGKGREKNDVLQGAGEAGGEGSEKQGAADLRDGGHAEPAGRKVGVQRAGGEPAAVGRPGAAGGDRADGRADPDGGGRNGAGVDGAARDAGRDTGTPGRGNAGGRAARGQGDAADVRQHNAVADTRPADHRSAGGCAGGCYHDEGGNDGCTRHGDALRHTGGDVHGTDAGKCGGHVAGTRADKLGGVGRRLTKIYIAGKITGDEGYREKFRRAAETVSGMGCIPLNPAEQPEGMAAQDYMRVCFAMIDIADAVLFLPDWRGSPGAMLEKAYCEYTKKPHVFAAGEAEA